MGQSQLPPFRVGSSARWQPVGGVATAAAALSTQPTRMHTAQIYQQPICRLASDVLPTSLECTVYHTQQAVVLTTVMRLYATPHRSYRCYTKSLRGDGSTSPGP